MCLPPAEHLCTSPAECHHEWQTIKAWPSSHPHTLVILRTRQWHTDYKDHLLKTAAKLKSRNNLLSKLAGTSLGANAKTLHTLALALCYSVAEYCCPAWLRSSHTASIDCQLTNTDLNNWSQGVRDPPRFHGCSASVGQYCPPSPRLSPESGHGQATVYYYKSLWVAINANVITNHPPQRPASCRSICAESPPIDISTYWEENWLSASVINHHLVCDPTIRQTGFHLLCQSLSLLNQFNTGQGATRCANLYKWWLAASELHNCGQWQTTSDIVDSCH